MKETTVRRLKNLYISELKKVPLASRLETNETVQELVPKKRDKLMIGEELD